MEIGRSLDPGLARTYPTPIHRTWGVATGKGTAIACRLPQGPSFELTDASRYDGFARQCTLVGDSLNDEQRRDDLFNPSSHQKPCPRIIDGRCEKHGPESEGGYTRGNSRWGFWQPMIQ